MDNQGQSPSRLKLAYWRLGTTIRHRQAIKQKLWRKCKSRLKKYNIIVKIYGKQPKKTVVKKTVVTVHYRQLLETQADNDFLTSIEGKLQHIPLSNGGRYYLQAPYKIGWISDTFLFDLYKDTATIIPLTPHEWQQQIEAIDLLFVVSTWHGLNEEWHGLASEEDEKRHVVYDIIAACRAKNIPTVFYSKEDPPNYQYFIKIAQQCDFIFTTAEEVIDDYRQDCGHNRVNSLCFGINPLFHNPVGFKSFEKSSDVIFSGSWMKKYPQRCQDLQTIFDGVLASGRKLKIIDRNYHLHSKSYQFPEAYIPFISPAVPHDQLQKIHKLYDWAININSVKNSTTMFANRAYELQACGNILLSNYSLGVKNKLPYVLIAQSSEETAAIIKSFNNYEDVYRHQINAIRFVMSKETCFDRLAQVLCTVGMPYQVTLRKVAVIAEQLTDKIKDSFDKQSYPAKSLLSSEQAQNSDLSDYDIIAFFHTDYNYGEFYLEDMINAFKYTACYYITKDAFVINGCQVAGLEHTYVSAMGDKYRSVFWRHAFDINNMLSWDGKQQLPNGYAIDHFNLEQKTN